MSTSVNQQTTGTDQNIETLRDQLQVQEKMASIGLLTAGIAHEVQNPLNFVINFSKLSAGLVTDLTDLLDKYKDRMDEDDLIDATDIIADLRGNLDKIQEHGDRALSIIRGILLQSRGKAGEFLPTDLPALIHEYVWLGYHAMRANDKTFNVTIHETYPEYMPQVMVIPQDYSRAVLNVVNNAYYTVHERSRTEGAAYTPTLDISAAFTPNSDGREGVFRLDIRDNGMGMGDETKARLFENFYSTKPQGQGTGLGMGITHNIITRLHKGEIHVESSLGLGTTFTFITSLRIIK